MIVMKPEDVATQAEEIIKKRLESETKYLEGLIIGVADQKELVEIAVAATSDSGNKAMASFLMKKYGRILKHG